MKTLRHGLKLKQQNTVSGRLKKAGCEMWNSWDDVSHQFDSWLNLLQQLGGDSFINFEQDIWEQARAYETTPHFGNLRQQHLLERLRDTVQSRWPFLQADFFINAPDTHFYVNGESVETLRDLDTAIGAYCRENDIAI